MSEYKKTVGICSVCGKPIFSGELYVGHKTKILEGLRIVQRFRSTSAAHQKRSKLDKYLKDYNLSSLANKERVKRIVLKLAEALNLLIIEIEHK